MKKNTILASAMVLGMIFSIPIASYANTYNKAEVKSNLVFVRTQANEDSALVSKAIQGQELFVLEEEGNWVKVKTQLGVEGYVNKNELNIKKTYEGIITNNGVNLRLRPNIESKALSVVNNSDRVLVLEKNGEWSKVLFEGNTGYVFSKFIATEDEFKALVSRAGQRNDAEKLLIMANSLIGTPYSYGSNGPNSFDCSSFIQYTYKNALGITLPRVSKDQARAGETVSKNDLKSGDIVAFNTFGKPGSITHVGIYLSDGNFIHASSSGDGVSIDSLSQGYYSNRYITASRILK